jgi:hypothetical protein
VCMTRKTKAKMSTRQAVAPIPAFMAGSMLWLRRRDGAAVVVLAFEGISFAFWSNTETFSRDKDGSTEHEGVVGKLLSREALCGYH